MTTHTFTTNMSRANQVVGVVSTTPKIMRALMILTAVLFVLYIALIARTVFAGIQRHALISETRDIAANVATLEVEYLQLSRTLSREEAATLGLTESKNILYAKVGDALTLNTN